MSAIRTAPMQAGETKYFHVLPSEEDGEHDCEGADCWCEPQTMIWVKRGDGQCVSVIFHRQERFQVVEQ